MNRVETILLKLMKKRSKDIVKYLPKEDCPECLQKFVLDYIVKEDNLDYVKFVLKRGNFNKELLTSHLLSLFVFALNPMTNSKIQWCLTLLEAGADWKKLQLVSEKGEKPIYFKSKKEVINYFFLMSI